MKQEHKNPEIRVDAVQEPQKFEVPKSQEDILEKLKATKTELEKIELEAEIQSEAQRPLDHYLSQYLMEMQSMDRTKRKDRLADFMSLFPGPLPRRKMRMVRKLRGFPTKLVDFDDLGVEMLVYEDVYIEEIESPNSGDVVRRCPLCGSIDCGFVAFYNRHGHWPVQ